MNMTKADAEKIVKESTRCTQATMRAFGIEGYPKFPSGCIQYLLGEGFTLRELSQYRGKTLNKFSKDINNDLDYLIFTNSHAMALIDGILIDTMRGTLDTRIINNIYIVKEFDVLE